MGNRVISQIKIGNEIFDIRDKIGPDGALHFIGINNWSEAGPDHRIHDGGNETPYINGAVVPLSNLKTGDVVLQNKSESTSSPTYVREEYLWIQTNATTYAGNWELLGDEGSYVIKGTTYNSNYASITGSVFGTHTFEGKAATINLEGTITGGSFTVSETNDTSVPSITWSGDHTHTITIGGHATESGHEWLPTTESYTITFTPSVTITLGGGSTESGHTFHGKATTVTVTAPVVGFQAHEYQPAGTVSIGGTTTQSSHTWIGQSVSMSHETTKATITSTGTYAPSGTITNPTLNLTPSTTVAVSGIAATTTGGVLLGTVAANSEILEIYNILANTANLLNTITGSIDTPKFNGTSKTVSVSTTEQVITTISNHLYTPNGDIKGSHTFTGTTATLTHTAASNVITATGTFTPYGDVYKPHIVSGTNTTITVTVTPHGSIAGSHTINTATVSFAKRLITAIQDLNLTASGPYTPEGTITVSNSGESGHTLSMVAHRHSVTLS